MRGGGGTESPWLATRNPSSPRMVGIFVALLFICLATNHAHEIVDQVRNEDGTYQILWYCKFTGQQWKDERSKMYQMPTYKTTKTWRA